jgi:hypothetical protein
MIATRIKVFILFAIGSCGGGNRSCWSRTTGPFNWWNTSLNWNAVSLIISIKTSQTKTPTKQSKRCQTQKHVKRTNTKTYPETHVFLIGHVNLFACSRQDWPQILPQSEYSSFCSHFIGFVGFGVVVKLFDGRSGHSLIEKKFFRF